MKRMMGIKLRREQGDVNTGQWNRGKEEGRADSGGWPREEGM